MRAFLQSSSVSKIRDQVYQNKLAISCRIIITYTIARHIVGEVVSLRTAEFRLKVFERDIAKGLTNSQTFSQIHRTWIMHRGNTYKCGCRYIRSSSFSLFGSVYFGANAWKARNTRNRWEKTRDKTLCEGLKLFIVQIVESNGRN